MVYERKDSKKGKERKGNRVRSIVFAVDGEVLSFFFLLLLGFDMVALGTSVEDNS